VQKVQLNPKPTTLWAPHEQLPRLTRKTKALPQKLETTLALGTFANRGEFFCVKMMTCLCFMIPALTVVFW
jgi:hypothetical protein